MSKLAQAVVEENASETLKDSNLDTDTLYLKKKMEDEIRMKLDEFARELSRARAQRENH